MIRRFVSSEMTVRQVEHRKVRQWVSGAGDKAVFVDMSMGYYLHLSESSASVFIGATDPGIVEGEKVKIILEVCK